MRILLPLVALCDIGIGCRQADHPAQASSAKPVVVYTSVDRIFSEPVLKRAQERLEIKVIGVYDTEETKSTGLVHRLIAKKDNPDGDVFWSGDPARSAALKAKGITAHYDAPGAKEIRDTFKDPEGHWIGFSARTRVLLVNTNLVQVDEEPRSIFELTQPKWKDRVAIANPLFGTTSFHMAALFETLGEAKARNWLDALKANDVQIVTSNGEVKRQVAGGQVAVGFTDSDDAAESIAEAVGGELVLMGSAGAKAMAVVRGEADIYAHTGGQYEWDNCAPAAVALAAGLHASRLDGSPLPYNNENPYPPDLLICRPEFADAAIAIAGGM